MHCIILLPDAIGRMPTAQELRRRGFTVSAAVALPIPPLAEGAGVMEPTQALALAAEEPAAYARPLRQEC